MSGTGSSYSSDGAWATCAVHNLSFVFNKSFLGAQALPRQLANPKISMEKSQTFSTAANVDVKIYQDKRVLVRDNQIFGNFNLVGIQIMIQSVRRLLPPLPSRTSTLFLLLQVLQDIILQLVSALLSGTHTLVAARGLLGSASFVLVR
jgi:hypothetical protein